MFVIREILHCKPGKVGDMIKKFKAINAIMDRMGDPTFRLSTDVSGEQFWTLVAEIEAETLDAFLEAQGRVMANDEARQVMGGYHDLLERGRREIYRVEA